MTRRRVTTVPSYPGYKTTSSNSRQTGIIYIAADLIVEHPGSLTYKSCTILVFSYAKSTGTIRGYQETSSVSRWSVYKIRGTCKAIAHVKTHLFLGKLKGASESCNCNEKGYKKIRPVRTFNKRHWLVLDRRPLVRFFAEQLAVEGGNNRLHPKDGPYNVVFLHKHRLQNMQYGSENTVSIHDGTLESINKRYSNRGNPNWTYPSEEYFIYRLKENHYLYAVVKIMLYSGKDSGIINFDTCYS